jgi:ubiquinone/menaquinone biosynthesis C-methylase UbiE
MSDYTLKVGNEGAKRLSLVDEIIGPYSRRFLSDAGLKKGMKVLELGCGTGNTTAWIADHVGINGHVIAVDGSKEQIDYAKLTCKDAGLNNVEFIIATAENLMLPSDSFDFSYSRLLLMHLKDPSSVIKKMFDLVKKGGIVANEEPNARALFTYGTSPIFERFNDILLKMGEQTGADFEIGDKLFDIHRSFNGKPIKAHFIMPMRTITEAKELVMMASKETLNFALNLKVITEEESISLLKELRETPDTGSGYYAWTR